ncbi:MAG TPA: hypothetical protein VEH62_00740 [Gemmatimonadales bacterium]|nr:hypothetical protein [Gemmatimonadales bacterium]
MMRTLLAAAGAALLLAPPCAAQDTSSAEASMAMDHAMAGAMAEDPHMVMTPRLPPAPGDSARADALVAEIRRTLARYRDVRAAEADGFRAFLPNVKQPVYHFTSWVNGLAARRRFDVARPTSLLYRPDGAGGFTLSGVMYTAPRGASLEELNRRIPLSVGRWHEHVNWCVPPAGERSRWLETKDGRPVFGPKSPIATAAACATVGGRFVPHLFGWMVHVQAFEGDDPAVVWATAGHDH